MHCLKLESFHVDLEDEEPGYTASLVKVRPILINISLLWHRRMVDPVNFIIQFPRLVIVHCAAEAIDSLDKFMPILEQLSDVQNIHVNLHTDITARFGSAKPKDLLLKRLSNVTPLPFTTGIDIRNTLKFVSQYFTSQSSFRFYCLFDTRGTSAEQDIFFRLMVNTSFAKDDYFVKFHSIPFPCLSNNFSYLLQNLFQKVSPAYKQSTQRVLELAIKNHTTKAVDLKFHTVESPLYRKVRIYIHENLDIDVLSTQLFNSGDAPIDEIDVFKLTFNHETPYLVDLWCISSITKTFFANFETQLLPQI